MSETFSEAEKRYIAKMSLQDLKEMAQRAILGAKSVEEIQHATSNILKLTFVHMELTKSDPVDTPSQETKPTPKGNILY